MNEAQQELMKQAAANAAIDLIGEGKTIGIGTGSTINYFITALAKHKDKFITTVASSQLTQQKLKSLGISVSEFNDVANIDLYFDGADACNPLKQLIKGHGAALTREKILATAAKQFICIIDETKTADYLGKTMVPLEVIPFARSYVARRIVKLGGQPILRPNTTTDNGNQIIDVANWVISEPLALEQQLNNIPGIICNGIFAMRPADLLVIGHKDNVSICN